MSRTIVLVEGDTAKDIAFVLSNADGPQDLTGATVRAFLKVPDSATPALEAACTIVTPLAGAGIIPAALRDASWVAGEYQIEWRVTYAGGAIDWFPSEEQTAVIIRERRTA
jgi:hypothetical protein